MATLRDVAREADLSISTVSRALTGHPHVHEETRHRVRSVAQELGYQPNALARALRRNQTKTVGLVIPDILNEFYASGATVLQSVLEHQGYRLILCISNNDPESDRRYLTALLQQRVDGIVHVPCTPDGARIVRESDDAVPVVELNRLSKSGLFDAVVSDDREGGLKVARYLLQLGHRRIGLIAGPESFSTTGNRLAGFREAFREAGLAVDPSLILHGDYSRAWGTQAVYAFMAMSPRPTALFVTGNQITLGALRGLVDLNLRVPDQVSLIGYDDPDWYAVWKPPITTYALPLKEMGLVAAQLLLARMAAAKTEASMPTVSRVAGQLVIRESCAPLTDAPQ